MLGCKPMMSLPNDFLWTQVLPDVSKWEYKGKQEVRNQPCNLWELEQR